MRAAHPPKLYSGRRRRKSTCRPASHALRRRAYSEFSALPMQAAVPTAHNLIRTRSPQRDRGTRKKQDRIFDKGSVIVHSATKAHESNEKIPGPATTTASTSSSSHRAGRDSNSILTRNWVPLRWDDPCRLG